MIKFFLGIAVVAFTSYCGRLLSKKYRQKKEFFKQLKEFNERFLSEIAYYRRPLRAFIASRTYEGEFQQLLTDYFSNVNERASEEKIMADNSFYSFLSEEEKGFVEDYFGMLGRGDTASQKGYFSSVKERLSALREESEKTAKRYGDLYVKLGFLCGLLILILIV